MIADQEMLLNNANKSLKESEEADLRSLFEQSQICAQKSIAYSLLAIANKLCEEKK